MKNQTRQYLLAAALLAALVLCWRPAPETARQNQTPGQTSAASSTQTNASALPPVHKIKAYSLTNAPKTAVGTWSTNLPSSPQQAQIIQQVAATIRASQSQNSTKTAPSNLNGFRDEKQVEAFRLLQARVGDSLQVYLRSENFTPNQLKGSPLAEAVNSGGNQDERNEATAKLFLRDNAALLLIDDADNELKLAHRQADELGGEVIRFTQHYQGLTVWPSEIGVHLDGKGNVDLVDTTYIATPGEVSVQPKLAANEAETKARFAVGFGGKASANGTELIIYGPLDKPARLAWKMDVALGFDKAWQVVIDAESGETLATISRVMSDNVSGSGTDLFGVTRPLNVWRVGSTFYMIDASKPMFTNATGNGFIETDDAIGQSVEQIFPNNVLQNIYYVLSASSTSWSNPDAVSASYNLSQTYDYYLNRHGRNSYNGRGSNIFAVVRIGGYANAFWSGVHKRMFFGNADRYAGSLDVIGHEWTHGVVDSIGQGVLLYQNQSGALNESFADIFGEMIEARTRGTNDWLIGSELFSRLRSMANPPAFSQPGTMSQFVVTTADYGGVHINSGIINRAYYLLAAGLPGAIGNADAERIFYRCLTVSMKPQSQFVDARLGCVAAAEYLFGTNSVQSIKTGEAFDGVELYAAPASAPQSTNVNVAVSAPGSWIFIRTNLSPARSDFYRIEANLGDSLTGNLFVTNVKLTRPPISGNGAVMLLVGADESLYSIKTDGTEFANFNIPGMVHSVAFSPDGRYWAFARNAAPGAPTNVIELFDAVSNLTSLINLVTPVPDGQPLTNVSYADAMSFSPDGKLLLYDAVSQLRGADGQLRTNKGIYALDMATHQQRVLIPAFEQFNFANPAFSKTSSRFLTLDALFTNGVSIILTLDLYQGSLGIVGASVNGFGYPGFNGDDSRVFYANEDLSVPSGRSVYFQILSADKMTNSGSPVLVISDAKLAVNYRRGTYSTPNTAPTVALTNPAPNAVFTVPAAVTLAASAGDIDGTIDRVEFYSGSTLLGTTTAAPYSMSMGSLSAGSYRVYARAYDNQGASFTTTGLTFTVTGIAPSIAAHPASLTLKVGSNATFSVTASGTATLTYQWRFNGASIPTATGTNYSIAGVTTNNAGNYDVVVTNAYGSVTSLVATLTVTVPPFITAQPTNISILAGGIAAFSVVATGTAPLRYQWLFRSNSLPGATNNTFTLANTARSNSGYYTVVVTNIGGSVTSSNALLAVGGVAQRILPLAALGNDRYQILFSDFDGGLLFDWDLNNLEVQGATNVNSTNWVTLTNAIVISNGVGQVEFIVTNAPPQQFYRIKMR